VAAPNGLAGVPSECLMVGDSAADIEADRRAGVRICAVRYGYGKPEDLADACPRHHRDAGRDEQIPSRPVESDRLK